MASTDFLTRGEWAQAVERRLGDVALVNFTVKPLGATRAGFLGDHYLAEITVREKNTNEERMLNFFLKTEPQSNEDQKAIINQTGCFIKEVGAVSKLFPLLNSALKDGGEGMEWTCKCFYTRPDAIVLDDLIHQGYRILGDEEPMTYGHYVAVLKSLANLHAASLIFEETRPQQPYRLEDELGDVLDEAFFRHAPNHPGTIWLNAGTEAALKLVELVHGEETLLQRRERVDRAMRQLYEYRKTSRRFRNTVVHGDLWKKNVLFLEEGGEAVAARLVDFQLVRYVPPACDVMCFLHLNASRSFRKKHASDLRALYYDHLTQNLKLHGLDPERVLSRAEFQESCEYYKNLGILISAHYGSIGGLNPRFLGHIFASSAEFERFLLHDRRLEVIEVFKNDEFFRESIAEIIDELIEEYVDREENEI